MAFSKRFAPSKYLKYDEKHFEGYWLQLNACIRHNEFADEILDKLRPHPLIAIKASEDEGIKSHLAKIFVLDGRKCPPTEADLRNDPIGYIASFNKAIRHEEAANEKKFQDLGELLREPLIEYRKGIKYIFEVALATLNVEEATTLAANVTYGAGLVLLDRLKEKHQRQTHMSLFVLFDSIISIRLKPNESLDAMFARITNMRQRLSNWTPTINIPDELVLVCILKALPDKYNATRTIVMATKGIDISTAKTMLLDAENRDAMLISKTLGSHKIPEKEATGLTGSPEMRDHKNHKHSSNRKGRNSNKTDAYQREGACSEHPYAGHASSECWILHPELKPKRNKRSTQRRNGAANMAKPDNAADEDANDSSTTEQDQLYGFFDDGLTITSHHKGQDPYDFLTNKKETLSSKVAGTDTKQTTAEGRADHNPSDEKDDPENPLAGWNPDNIQYAESTERIRTTDNYATDLIPVLSSGNNHYTDDLNRFDADDEDQGMRDTDQEMQTNVQPSNTRAARAGTKMAPMHQYSKEHFKRICRKIKSSITPEEYEHATRHTSRNHHRDVFVKMSIPQPCKRRRSLAIYDLLSSTNQYMCPTPCYSPPCERFCLREQ